MIAILLVAGHATFTLTHPPDGATIHYGDAGAHTNVSLRYRVDVPLAEGRICVEIQRARRGSPAFVWFAEGCFRLDQPLTLMLPTAEPASFLVQAALADGSVALAHARAAFQLAPAPPFEPTYEWAAVLPGATVPVGLEVQMALDGSGTLARIPDPFRLQLSLPAQLGIFRGDVFKASTIGEIAALLDAHALRRLQLHPGMGSRSCADLALGVTRDDGVEHIAALPISVTAEECKLFTHQSQLRVIWRPCEDEHTTVDSS